LEQALTPVQDLPASPVARIKMALCLVAEDPLTDPLLARQLFAATMRQQENKRIGAAFIQLLAEQVRQAQAAGEIRTDIDAPYLGATIRALFFQQILMWYQGYRPSPLPTMLAQAIDLLLDGVAGPEWETRT
jgi:hypothetical protein